MTCAGAIPSHGPISCLAGVPRTSTRGRGKKPGTLGQSAGYLAGLMSAVSLWIGVVGAILALAGISRLLVLPFAVKAERDQIRRARASAEMDDIKQRLKDDPVRKARAIRAFYKRHGITPGRNLIAMLFLPIMAVAVLAVQDLAAMTKQGLPWIPDLADRDPWLILPLVFGVLITALCRPCFRDVQRMQRIAIWLAALPALYRDRHAVWLAAA